MLFWGNKKSVSHSNIGKYVRSYAFQRLFIGIITVILAFILVDTGAAPKKYRLTVGAASTYDINAPRDIENKLKTEENAKAAASAVEPVMKVITAASLEVYRSMDDFIAIINEARNSIAKKLEAAGLGKKDAQYAKLLETETEAALIKVSQDINKSGIPLSTEQIRYLLSKVNDGEISAFSKICRDVITDIMKDDITEDNLIFEINKAQNQFESKEINQDLKNIGAILVKSILKPNRIIDAEATKKRKEEVYNRQENIVKILKGERIISYGDTVTPDKYSILEELKLIEAKGSFDIVFSIGILLLILLLALILLLYMNRFCKSILYNRDDILILCLNILLVLTIARWVSLYSALAIPIFIATMTISIIMDIKLSIIVNFILTAAIGLMTKGSADFIYISLISGTLSAFLVNKANQRSTLSAAGLLIGFVNAVIVVCLGLINKSGFADIVSDAAIVFLNGILSIILTIGMLPFWESTFNVITPLKLLELANPNQPLLKRLLMEAPGTYHHSLMVGNLAEVATEAIGGDALLARVGAYFHDVGKLARPNFFKENQLSDNPHDKITPNLSTLIITSHATDGTELAKKHKIPLAIRDIISQHHGTTLVAYFYHKASKGDKGDQVKQENFRYEGPRPSSKEAAVVMVADSVEAAVRSMADKTEGKMEGLIRKIIKDKLDDGQFDLCDLTLKDLDIIARSFLRVFSGYFHERQQYPDIRVKSQELEKIESIDEKILTEEEQKGKKVSNGNTD